MTGAGLAPAASTVMPQPLKRLADAWQLAVWPAAAVTMPLLTCVLVGKEQQ